MARQPPATHCLFNSLLRQTTKKTPNSTLLFTCHHIITTGVITLVVVARPPLFSWMKLPSKLPSIRYFPTFSELPNYPITFVTHWISRSYLTIAIGETCQIWIGFKCCNMYSLENQKYPTTKLKNGALVTPSMVRNEWYLFDMMAGVPWC